MPVGPAHYIKNPFYEIEWHIDMEQIAHGINKYRLRLLQPQRQLQNMLMYCQLEAIDVIGLTHGF
jgi:hypothetical protein